jgi:hypothetical protein
MASEADSANYRVALCWRQLRAHLHHKAAKLQVVIATAL